MSIRGSTGSNNTVYTRKLQKVQIDRLAIGGAGNRSNAYMGALHRLRKHLVHTRHFVGVSAGSLLACLLAMNITAKELIAREKEMPFGIQMKWYLLAIWQICWHQNGVVPISELRKYLCQAFDRVRPHASTTMTFNRLFQKYKATVEIQAVDIKTGKRIVFNRVNTPDCLLVDAVCASCAIPGIFSPFEYDGHVLVDGAILLSFPWKSLDNPDLFLPVIDPCTLEPLDHPPVTVGLVLHHHNGDIKELKESNDFKDSKDSKDSNHSKDTTIQVHESNPIEGPKKRKKMLEWWTHLQNSMVHVCTGVPPQVTSHSSPLSVTEYTASEEPSSSWSWSSLLSVWYRAFKQLETGTDHNHKNLIRIPVDSNVHGSIFHALWPTPEQKEALQTSGSRAAHKWILMNGHELNPSNELKEYKDT
ncbi:MAG: patatin [Sylvanvirus sp.]|uniref:Patatin n=1 Tax=Sylvanvirus sp. TaxID=2487774 RepID=A0A3G5AJN4_9VIRU|nr:MAG: patatin [Sylvanvirus sp.]